MIPPESESLRQLARRSFFTSAASGLGSIAASTILADDSSVVARSNTEVPPEGATSRGGDRSGAPRASATSCIFIFLAGGPCQFDLFDEKPLLRELDGQRPPDSLLQNARFAFIKPESTVLIGSPHKFSRYGQSGMALSELLPNLGGVADELALLRTIKTDVHNHHPAQLMLNCGTPRFGHPSLGSWLVYGLGSETKELPEYAVLWTEGNNTYASDTLWSNGFLPERHRGVRLRSSGSPLVSIGSPDGISASVQRRTIEALRTLDGLHQGRVGNPQIGDRIVAYERAFAMQTAIPELDDLSRETQATRSSYGIDRKALVERSFARNCLMARRLVERGVRFVNVYLSNWDHHTNIDRSLPPLARAVDQPVAALIRDLKTRGMLDSTLVVFAGEFGRTPMLDNGFFEAADRGRDHHPNAFSIWMAGGGVRGGQTIGKTDDFGWDAIEDPWHVSDVHATILHLFGIDHQRLTYRHSGREFRLTDVRGNPISPLVS